MKAGAFCIVLAFHVEIIFGKTMVEMRYFGNCKDSDLSAPFHLEDTQVGLISADVSEFNTTLVIWKDMNLVDITVMAYKCKSVNEAECEMFMSFLWTDACPRLMERGQFFSEFADKSEPPLSCPFKKGTHRISHGRANVKLLEPLMEDNIMYLVKNVHRYRGAYVGCLMVKAKKMRLRNRKKNVSSS